MIPMFLEAAILVLCCCTLLLLIELRTVRNQLAEDNRSHIAHCEGITWLIHEHRRLGDHHNALVDYCNGLAVKVATMKHRTDNDGVDNNYWWNDGEKPLWEK